MMDGTFVEQFRASLAVPHVPKVDDRDRLIAPPGWHEIERKIPVAESLKIGTLTGLVDYVLANPDALTLGECLVHVRSHSTVDVRSRLDGEGNNFRRQVYLTATLELVAGAPFPFGQYQEAEPFFVAVQCFVPTSERDALLSLIKSIRESQVRDTADSGIAQEVKTAKGIALVNNTPVPNPFRLRPYRTFREVEQPESAFILRLASGAADSPKPKCALFEADGGAWKLTAIQAIAAFLRDKLGDRIALVA